MKRTVATILVLIAFLWSVLPTNAQNILLIDTTKAIHLKLPVEEPDLVLGTIPAINFTTKSGTSTPSERFTVAACVETDSDLKLVRVFVNKKPVGQVGKPKFRSSCTNAVSKEIVLQYGKNEVYIEATNQTGKGISDQITIYRKIDAGTNYALIIAVSDYNDRTIGDLHNVPIDDANKLAKVLTNRYTFSEANITQLNNPTRSEIMRTWTDVNKIVGENDNLLIFYAGHGHYNKGKKMGYWWPKDAEKQYDDNWIYNDQIISKIQDSKAKHVLLIADACFSGSIFEVRGNNEARTGTIEKLNQLKSRTAITSGLKETVPNESVFMEKFLEVLKTNSAKYTTAQQLHAQTLGKYGTTVTIIPKWGDLPKTDNDFGDFIFTLRK